MFKNLLHFWKGKDFLNQVLEDFKNMLDDTETMFQSVCKKLIYNQDPPGLKDKIYNVDKTVNDLERDIRKRVIEHLSVQPSVDVPTCLLLMSVVKDAERLGDYAKNLYEVIELLDAPMKQETYMRLFNHIENDIAELFMQTKAAFIESDENKAKHSWETEREITKRCEEILGKVAKSTLTVNEAVCFALTARYYKRIASHLANIATSVILPLTDLDYFDERRRG